MNSLSFQFKSFKDGKKLAVSSCSLHKFVAGDLRVVSWRNEQMQRFLSHYDYIWFGGEVWFTSLVGYRIAKETSSEHGVDYNRQHQMYVDGHVDTKPTKPTVEATLKFALSYEMREIGGAVKMSISGRDIHASLGIRKDYPYNVT